MFERLSLALSACLMVLGATELSAQNTPAIPGPLQSWVGWVLEDVPNLYCPSTPEGRECVWPGELSVSTTSTGASFEYRVFLDTQAEIQLPGNRDYWPQDLSVNRGNETLEVALIERDEAPFLRLPAGEYQVRGRFFWDQAPEVLAIPSSVGRVTLSLSGREIAHPRMSTDSLWLGDKASEKEVGESESVKATIYRKISDDVPLRVITRLQLNVSGKAREVELGNILFEGALPVRVQSSIPTRVPSNGSVSVYVRPGTHTVEIETITPNEVSELSAPTPGPQIYEPQEYWAWEPNELIRSVKLDGATGVDPERTSLPEEWRQFASYLVEPGTKATFTELRRGMAEPSPNLINLRREFWLDLDGQGYSVRDRLNGTMNQGWRLNLGQGKLGRVTDTSEGSDLLITKDAESELPGVEIRKPGVSLEAESRLEEALSQLTIVGWNHDVQSLNATVHLPPGWSLLGGSGVDRMPGTWLESWRLWDFFFVLLVALSAGKLLGWRWFPVALLALILSHGHHDAPTWVWVVLLATLALLRVLPEGLIRKAVIALRIVALVSLAIILAPFARDQVRWAVHPQVADPQFQTMDTGFGVFEGDRSFAPQEVMAPAAEMEPMQEEAADEDFLAVSKVDSYERGYGGSARSVKKERKWALQQVDPNAVVQTGYGVPTWSWTTWRLEWVGPVRQDHEIRLYLLGPLANAGLNFVRVALLILLALLMISRRDMAGTRAKTMATALVMLLAGTANAAEPPPIEPIPIQNNANLNANLIPLPAPGTPEGNRLLEELKRRLVKSQECSGECVVVSRADISVRELNFRMRAEVFAERDASWTLPGPADPLTLSRVALNGTTTNQLRREENGLVLVRVPQGRSVIEVEGVLVNRNSLTIQFHADTKPRYVTFRSSDWTVDGIGPSGLPDSSLQLTRQSGQAASDAALTAELPPYFFVERTWELGLPWQIRTVIRRQDASRPQLLKFTIGEQEKVISDGIRTEQREALVDFARGVSVVEFLSEIPISESVNISAPLEKPWTETWRVQCSQMWRCDFSELPRISDVNNGVYEPLWKPWPSESLVVSVSRPDATEGPATTVDKVSYALTPGKRLLQGKLEVEIRSSTATNYEITLPEGAELQRVFLGGDERSIRPRDSKVSLPIVPGKSQYVLEWQQPWERSFKEQVPAVKLGSDSVNVETTIEVGEDRWLIWVSGPQWGPAILFWPHLLTLLLIALLLGRIPHIPVKTWEWLLLVIGLSQVPVVVGLPIVLWFVLLSLRQRKPAEEWWKFDLSQLGLVGLTLIAAGALYGAIHTNLLFDVDMQVEGARSSNRLLRWYMDQSAPALAEPALYSLPILVWRILMFLWAFWLVSRLISWVKWGWSAFSEGGLWKSKPKLAVARPRTQTEAGSPVPPSGLEPNRKEHGTLPGVPSPNQAEPNVQRRNTPSHTDVMPSRKTPPAPESTADEPTPFSPPQSEAEDDDSKD